MPDLIERAPADPTLPAAPTAAPSSPPAGQQPQATEPPKPSPDPAAPVEGQGQDGQPPKSRPPVDLDARLEEVLTESRRVADLDKQVAAREKALADREEKWKAKATVDELLAKGDRKGAVRALLDGKVDEELLFDLASELVNGATPETGQPKPPPLTVEEQVAAVLEAREKAAADKKAAEDKAKQEADTAAARTQMDTFLTSSAAYLKANLDQFPFIKAWGCDSTRYQELLIAHAEKTGQLPEPAVLLKQIEDEHLARWQKSPHAPKAPPPIEDLDAHVAATYERNKPTTPEPAARPRTALEIARAELQEYDRQQAERIRYSQG
ncbi:MAG TPA: hypothetical protein VJ140_19640 [Actinomycetota bacterium]|nr:hypothetical protein [Actinomycetota bacterium]